MIYSLNGKVLEKSADRVVLECGGVGYEVFVPSSVLSAIPSPGGNAVLYTYLNITETDVSLFGFLSAADRQMFKMLIGVSGVGPKVGIAILSVLSCERAALAISAGDAKAFTAASGVGPKLGQRIVLELKDKVGKGIADGLQLEDVSQTVSASGGSAGQAVAALVSLGYTQSEAAQAVSKCDPSSSTEEMIRHALRSMAGKVR